MDAETKSIIRSLVASTPIKSTIRTILKDYYDTVGFELPFKELGFNNPEQYLRSLPDVVQIVGTGPQAEVRQVRSQKLDHINDLVSKQRIPKGVLTNRRKPVSRARVAGTNPIPPHLNFIHRHLSLPFPPPLFNHYERNVLSHPLLAQNSIQSHINQLRIQNGNRGYSRPPQTQQTPSPPPPQKQQSPPPPPPRSEPPRRYEPPEPPLRFRSPEAPQRYGFERISTSTPSRQESPQKQSSPKINRKYIENKLLSVEDEDSMFYDEVEERVPEEVKNNLRDLIGDHPEGIWCCDLPKLYVSRYLTELDYAAYKFRTLNEMCLYLASVFHYIRPNKGDFKLYDKRAPIPDDLSVKFCLDGDEEKGGSTVTVASDSEILNLEALGFSDQPSNVVQYLEDIPRQWLSENQKQGSLIDVWIAEVYDPSKFWFIINKQKLDDMMNEMQLYYGSNKHKYEIPPHKLKEGLYCCAILFAEYHRAIVVAKSVTPTDEKIKLYFIDYGTVAKVPIKGICYLHRKYAVLPQQAMRGRLAGIYPPCAQQQWSRSVCAKFFDLIAEKPLVARIDKINLQKQFVHITLIETPAKGSLEPPIFINEVLIKEGYAVATPEAQKEVEMNKYAIPIVRHLHFYPTYEELEQGLVPSAPEMINLLHNGCSLELIYPQYFQKSYYKHELQKLRTEVFHSRSASSDESVDAQSSCSSNVTTEECKSSGMDELVNFTEDMIPDKGGTSSSETDSQATSHHKRVALTPLPPEPEPVKTKERQPPSTKNQTVDAVASSEAPQSNPNDTSQEVVEESLRTALTLKPPPGFERVRPNCVVQQNFVVPPQNLNYYPPVVQQNYFLPTYGGYQLPFNYPLQMPFNYYPMYPFQQMAPPVLPQPTPAQLEPIITEYMNALRNDTSATVETEKSESSDSEVIACGTLANENDGKVLQKEEVGTKIDEVTEKTANEVLEVKKSEREMEMPQEKEIKKDDDKSDQAQIVNESEENTKKKKRKQKKQKTSESEQCETDSKLKQDCEKIKASPNKVQSRSKNYEEPKTAKKTPEKDRTNRGKESTDKVESSESNSKVVQVGKTEKSKNASNKTDKRKESVDVSENVEGKVTRSKSKAPQDVKTKGNTEKVKNANSKNDKTKGDVDKSENSESILMQSTSKVVERSIKTENNEVANNKIGVTEENVDNSDYFENKLAQSKVIVSHSVETIDSWEKSESLAISDYFENKSEQSKNNVLPPVETVDSWEELIDDDVCLLDTNEAELVALLSRPSSSNDAELDALGQFFVDNTAPLLPQKITDVDREDECDEEIIERTPQIKYQKCVEKKVIAGKTISIVTWEQKRYVVCNEALKTFTGLELSVLNTKSRLSRRKIFMTDIDVNTIETEVQEEFNRNNLVTPSKFGKFVHLIQLDQLPSFVETFTPEKQLNITDIL